LKTQKPDFLVVTFPLHLHIRPFTTKWGYFTQ